MYTFHIKNFTSNTPNVSIETVESIIAENLSDEITSGDDWLGTDDFDINIYQDDENKKLKGTVYSVVYNPELDILETDENEILATFDIDIFYDGVLYVI